MYTTSSVFLQTLSAAGITHVFVNWGSDHPALLEDLERQRTENRGDQDVGETGKAAASTNPTIITCPNEMVALSAAQGYAQVTGNPAAVIVHVDVGTQAMAGAIHNVDRSRTPVLIYAGASPFSSEGEYKGSRNEWIMWLQDIPDQTAIVRQYMRFTGQISSARTVSQSVKRALQIAKSEPRGPVYLWARREVMEEEVSGKLADLSGIMNKWPPVEPTALAQSTVQHIARSLMRSKTPLVITSHIGRKPKAIQPLLELATILAIPIVNTCPSTVNVPASHPSFAGVTFLFPGTHSPYLNTADTILVIESDIPWIEVNQGPDPDAQVFVIDSGDPLRGNMGSWHVAAQMILRADPEEGLKQILQVVTSNWDHKGISQQELEERRNKLAKEHRLGLERMSEEERTYPDQVTTGGGGGSFTVPNIIGVLRDTIQRLAPASGALFLNETISNYPAAWMHLQAETPGSVLSSGGSSLGWALGAAVGAYIGNGITDETGVRKSHELVVVIVGDGSYLFGVPSSAYWMARKYDTPFLTIILNNGGWRSPKLSMLGIHPTGHGSKVSGAQLSVGFGPHTPDYAQIAVAASAGWAWGRRVGDNGADINRQGLANVITEAVSVVLDQRRCAVVDCVLESI